MSDHDESIQVNESETKQVHEESLDFSICSDGYSLEDHVDQDEILILDQDLETQLGETNEQKSDTYETIHPDSEESESTDYEAEDVLGTEVTEGHVQPMIVEESKGDIRNILVFVAASLAVLLAGSAYYYFNIFKDPGQNSTSKVVTAEHKPTGISSRPTSKSMLNNPVLSNPVNTPDKAPDVVPPTHTPVDTPSNVPSFSPVEPDRSTSTPVANPVAKSPKPEPDRSDPDQTGSSLRSNLKSSKPPITPTPEKIQPQPITHAQEALEELIQLTLAEGFSRVKSDHSEKNIGIKVLLNDGKEIALAHGESLVELKNGNHFKGHMKRIDSDFLYLSFSYGTIKIPKGDLNQIVPSGSAGDLPLEAYQMGIVYLRNGNRLTGKIIKAAEDRVILGFPSAQIIIPRSAIKPEPLSIEYIESDTKKKYYGVSIQKDSPGDRNKYKEDAITESLLGVPYYDFDNGFSLVPPKGWEKYSKEAIMGFQAPSGSKWKGSLVLGGLYIGSSGLKSGLHLITNTQQQKLPGIQFLGGVQSNKDQGVPWDFQFDCQPLVKPPKTGETSEAQESTKYCRTYIYSKFGRVFILSMFAHEKDFKSRERLFEQSATTFKFRN